MIAYKGTDKDMQCRGVQYALGCTYEEHDVALCIKGFHACTNPLDVFAYYPPGHGSRYFEVELGGNIDDSYVVDSAVAASKITFLRELTISDLAAEHLRMVANRGKGSKAGRNGVATAGHHGVAKAGDFGVAAAGYNGAATAGHRVSVGKGGCGLVRGRGVAIRGGLGAVLVIAVEQQGSYALEEWASVAVDGETVKADTWYRLEGGGTRGGGCMTMVWILVYIGAGACVTAFLSLVDKMEGKDG